MASSNARRTLGCAVLTLSVGAFASRAGAQPQAQGFAIDRLYTSAPGAGWFVMDDLAMHGGLGGAMAVTTDYARDPLRLTGGSQPLAVVSNQSMADFGFAVTYDRWRLYLNLDAPLLNKGQSGTVGDYKFIPPSVDLGSKPDALADARIGLDARLVGDATSPLRVGASAQLFVPEGISSDYDSDGTVRAMLRALVAGNQGPLVYAGQLGVHIRPLDEAPTPGGPQGSELLYGLAAGAKVPLAHDAAVVIGPEFYGETAFKAFFGSATTGLEALLTSRIEGTANDGAQVRVKLGTGGGISPHFGAPEWRAVLSVEVFDQSTRASKP
ncbi:MAG: hypothetical protein ACLP1X_07990 [Polyangiaceae bacterium]